MHPMLMKILRDSERRASQWRQREAGVVPVGVLTLVTMDLAGRIVDVQSGHNVVTKKGRQALAHVIAGDNVATHKVTDMQFGDGTGTPAVTDTSLFGSIILMAASAQFKAVTTDFPDSGGDDMKVRFTVTVNADEGNGGGTQVYREAALLKGNGDFFSHKVSGDITKDDTVVLTAQWTLIF